MNAYILRQLTNEFIESRVNCGEVPPTNEEVLKHLLSLSTADLMAAVNEGEEFVYTCGKCFHTFLTFHQCEMHVCQTV